MSKFIILGVYIGNRVKTSQAVQRVLTDFGCNIKVRIGLHEADDKKCSVDGLIILQVFGGNKTSKDIKRKLEKIPGVKIKEMLF